MTLPDQGGFADGGGSATNLRTNVRCSWYPTHRGWGWSATCSWGGNIGEANSAADAERSARKAMEWFESGSPALDEGCAS